MQASAGTLHSLFSKPSPFGKENPKYLPTHMEIYHISQSELLRQIAKFNYQFQGLRL